MEPTTNDIAESPAGLSFWRFATFAGPLIAISAILALLSHSCYQDDDLAHYLLARAAKGCLIDVWGRPGFTIPYATVAWVGSPETGWMLCRLLTVAIVAATAWFTADVTRRLRIPQPELAALLFLATPLSFLLSFTTLTESICGLYLIAGTWLLVTNRNWLSALCWSIAMTTRHEAIVYLVPVGLYFLWRRDVLAAILLGSGELLWNVVAWFAGQSDLPWRRYIDAPGESGYGSGTALTGVQMWIDAVGPGIAVLALIGAVVLAIDLCKQLPALFFRHSKKVTVEDQHLESLSRSSTLEAPADESESRPHADACRFMGMLIVVGGGLGTVALQAALYMFNRFASGGYARFLVPSAPWVAICAAVGLIQLWSSIGFMIREAMPQDHRKSWNQCSVHLAIALLIGAGLAFTMESLQLFYIGPLQLFLLFTAVAAVAFVVKQLKFNGMIPVVYVTLLVASGISWGFELKPYRKTPIQSLSAEVADWWRNTADYRDRAIMTNCLWFSYSSGEFWCGPEDWASSPTGSLLVYAIDNSTDYNKWLQPDQVRLRTIREWTSANPTNPTDETRLVLFEKLPQVDVSSSESSEPQRK